MASATSRPAAADDGIPTVPLDEWTEAALKTALASAGSAATVDLGASASDHANLVLAEAAVPGLVGRVRVLDLSECEVGPEPVSQPLWPQLRELHLQGAVVAQGFLSPSAPFSRVHTLLLSGADIDGFTSAGDSDDDDASEDGGEDEPVVAPDLAKAFPALQHLDMSDCRVSDAALTSLRLPASLQSLDLSGTPLSSAATLADLAKRLPRLSALSLADTPLSHGSAAKCKAEALKAFPSLVALNGARIGAAGLRRAAGEAACCSGASDVAFRDASSCSCLEGEPVSRARRRARLPPRVPAAVVGPCLSGPHLLWSGLLRARSIAGSRRYRRWHTTCAWNLGVATPPPDPAPPLIMRIAVRRPRELRQLGRTVQGRCPGQGARRHWRGSQGLDSGCPGFAPQPPRACGCVLLWPPFFHVWWIVALNACRVQGRKRCFAAPGAAHTWRAARVTQSLQLGSGPSRSQEPRMRVTPRKTAGMAASPSAAPAAAFPKMQRKSPTEVRAMDFEPVDAKTREQSAAIVEGVKAGGEAALLDFATKFGDLKPGEGSLLLSCAGSAVNNPGASLRLRRTAALARCFSPRRSDQTRIGCQPRAGAERLEGVGYLQLACMGAALVAGESACNSCWPKTCPATRIARRAKGAAGQGRPRGSLGSRGNRGAGAAHPRCWAHPGVCGGPACRPDGR